MIFLIDPAVNQRLKLKTQVIKFFHNLQLIKCLEFFRFLE